MDVLMCKSDYIRLDDYNSTTFGTVYGFLYSCTYKGRDCANSR
jgi:hypothetical protein